MLRGINVGGRNKINMEQLARLYSGLGLKNVQTYIQSGNVTFDSSQTDIQKIRSDIQYQIAKSFGYEVAVILRTTKELQSVIKRSPYVEKDPAKLYVTFLSERPKHIQMEVFNGAKDKDEEFSILEKEIYIYCPNGYGRTKLNNNFFEYKLGVDATTRNWNTVNTLLSMSMR